MERVINASRKVWFSLTTQGGDATVNRGWRRLMSVFTLTGPQADARPNYQVRSDHLFLPECYSIKKHFSYETIVGLVLITVLGTGLVFGVALVFSISPFLVISTIIALFYFVFMVFKLVVIMASFKYPPHEVTPARLAALDEKTLPTYTVLIPLRDEAEVMEQILAAMTAIDYPKEKLEFIVTVEQYDTATKEAMERCGLPDGWRVLELPDTKPKTKPKAINCAFLDVHGEYLVIYDAEIIPDTDQLKKAVATFQDHPELSALQPRLDHYNTYQNLLTRLFTMEFTFHYDLFLPGLASYKLPLPLSGHSTHFRTSALRHAGAWDPYNVAEDCEVGMRLYRLGYRAGLLDSRSLEEAASSTKSWVAQRTRWMKGFIQTSIVHLRYPKLTRTEMGGWGNFMAFLFIVPGTVLINVLNLFFWIILLSWIVFEPEFIQTLYPLPVLYTANIAAIIGGFLFIYLSMIALYRRNKFGLVRWWFFIPAYWFLLAYATVRASKQVMTNPYLWEKTTHGTHLNESRS